jgi:hypothetical protein
MQQFVISKDHGRGYSATSCMATNVGDGKVVLGMFGVPFSVKLETLEMCEARKAFIKTNLFVLSESEMLINEHRAKEIIARPRVTTNNLDVRIAMLIDQSKSGKKILICATYPGYLIDELKNDLENDLRKD